MATIDLTQLLESQGLKHFSELPRDSLGNLRNPVNGANLGNISDYIIQEQARQAATTPTIPTTTTPTTATNPSLSDAEKNAWLSQVLGNGLTRQEYQDVARNLGYTGEFGAGGHAKYLEENPARKDALNQAVEQALTGKYNTRVSNEFLPEGMNVANRVLSSRGLDPNEFSSDITRILTDQYKALPTNTKDNPNKTLDIESIINNELNNIQGNRRSQYQQQVNQFAPDNFSKTSIADTYDDQVIDKILSEQQTGAQQSLDRQIARKKLNNTGASTATNALNSQAAAARSKLQELGGTVLSGYRTKLDDIISGARTGASNYQLGQKFDPNTYKSQIDTTLGGFGSSLEGDIRNVVGGQSLFDVGNILSSGQVAQGITNPRTANLAATVAQQNTNKKDRGLGSQGAF